jgi:hypothetical protein
LHHFSAKGTFVANCNNMKEHVGSPDEGEGEDEGDEGEEKDRERGAPTATCRGLPALSNTAAQPKTVAALDATGDGATAPFLACDTSQEQSFRTRPAREG